jgi:hypothetical protein
MGLGRARRCRTALAAVVLTAAACNGLTVDQRGVYTSGPITTITGEVTVNDGETLVSLTVDGIDATIDGGHYRAEVPLDGDAIFTDVVVEAHYSSGEVLRERRTVVFGDGQTAEVLPPGATLSDAVGLRVNERSFTKLGPVVKSLTTFDPGAVAPPGSVFLDECVTKIILCTVYVKASTAAAPAIAGFDVALDSNQGNVRAVVTLHNLHVPIAVAARVVGAPVNCTMNVDAAGVTIDGRYLLGQDPVDPHLLDVNLVGATPTVTLTGVTHDFVGGVCSVPGIEQIVGLFLPDVQRTMRTALTSLLGDPDGAGPVDAPVAEAVEGALAKLNLAGDIGGSLGLTLDSTLQSVDVDPAGIGLRATGAFTAAAVAPEAPDLTGSVGFPGDALGPLPTASPGGRPFDVAVGASASSFNQLLAGETERGLLNVDVTSLGGVPLSLKALYDLVGAGGLVTQDRPLAIALRPEVAPIVTTGPGPGGALGELVLHGYRATIRTTDDNAVFLELVLDFRTGVGLELTDGGLGFTFDPPAAEDLAVTVTQNPNHLPDALVTGVFGQVTPQVFASVQDVLPRFPLPGFAGMGLAPVEIGRVSSGFVLFADLVPAAA